MQALELSLAQARLAPSASRLFQTGLALSTTLLYPPSHGLANHFDLAGNGRLILTSLVQADGLEAAFL
jgi:hypothetical protein